MTPSPKTAYAAAAICAVGLLAWLAMHAGGASAPPSAVRTTPTGARGRGDASTRHPDLRAHAPPQRTAASVDGPEPAPWLAHPYELALEITVRDEFGVPVEGYTPELAPAGGELRRTTAATDADGRVVVRWAARRPRVDVDVRDPRGHRRLVPVAHGRPARITMLQRGPLQAVAWQSVVLVASVEGSGSCVIRASRPSRMLQPGLHPHAVFAEQGIVRLRAPASTLDEAPTELAVGSSIVSFDDVVLDFGKLGVRGSTLSLRVHGFEPPSRDADADADAAADTAGLEGVVYGEDGAPTAHVPVALFGASPQPLDRAVTDADGRFTFARLVPNELQVRAGGGPEGLAQTTVRVGEGTSHVSLQLRQERCVRGVLRRPDGAAIGGAQIEWHAADGTWADATTTGDDGRFVLANLPPGPGMLLAWGDGRLPIAHEPGVIADAGEVVLVHDPDADRALRLAPRAPDGIDLAGVQVLARQLATGIGVAVEAPKPPAGDAAAAAAPPWRLADVPPGHLDVALTRPGCGHVPLGRHWFDGRADVDLGDVALPAPGRVRFASLAAEPPADLGFEIAPLLPAFDVGIEPLRSLADEILLAPGDYVLTCRRGERALRFTRFSVRSGLVTSVSPAW